jgi:hypothetical protein
MPIAEARARSGRVARSQAQGEEEAGAARVRFLDADLPGMSFDDGRSTGQGLSLGLSLGTIRNSMFAVKEGMAARGLTLAHAFERIERGIVQCDRIITDLLDYARARSTLRMGCRRRLARPAARRAAAPDTRAGGDAPQFAQVAR